MTKALAHRDAFRDAAPADIYESMRNAIDHQLQHGLYERLDTDYIHGAIANAPQISGAIFLSLHPRQLTLLIADARVSIVLAVQRHLDNEQYRRRLAQEFSTHYRARFSPTSSETFRTVDGSSLEPQEILPSGQTQTQLGNDLSSRDQKNSGIEVPGRLPTQIG